MSVLETEVEGGCQIAGLMEGLPPCKKYEVLFTIIFAVSLLLLEITEGFKSANDFVTDGTFSGSVFIGSKLADFKIASGFVESNSVSITDFPIVDSPTDVETVIFAEPLLLLEIPEEFKSVKGFVTAGTFSGSVFIDSEFTDFKIASELVFSVVDT